MLPSSFIFHTLMSGTFRPCSPASLIDLRLFCCDRCSRYKAASCTATESFINPNPQSIRITANGGAQAAGRSRQLELTHLTKLFWHCNYSCSRPVYTTESFRSCGFLSKITPSIVLLVSTQIHTSRFAQAIQFISYHLSVPGTIQWGAK